MTNEPRLLGGRYLLGDLLGRGGMAEVHRAVDTRLNRDVAVKQLRIDLASDLTFQERFRREAQSSAGLNHPNIVAVYDTGEEIDLASGVSVPYIVMELVQGYTLRELLRTGRKIQPAKALEFVTGVLDALDYSHKNGIIHRDIKPANVMLTPAGQVKVMDFGIARAVADTSSTMTQTAAVIGTASYFSPEQARGESVDARSDIYSTGCLLYELLVGRPPFVGDSPVSVAYQHVQEPPVPPSRLDSLVTPSMDAVVLRALAKNPDARYQTASAMLSDVTRILTGQDVNAAVAPTATVPLLNYSPAAAATVLAGAVPAATVPSAAQAVEEDLATEEEEEAPRRFIGLWIFLSVLVLVCVAVGIYLFVSNSPSQPELVTVPQVTDRTEAEATQILLESGLQVAVEPIVGPDDNTLGRVVRQNPVTGAKVDPNWKVIIEVNTGPVKIDIPTGLLGQKYEDVVKELESLGFTAVTAEVATQEPIAAKTNTVTSISPAEGTKEIPIDTPITVSYATGKSEVPNVVGNTQAGAIKQLKKAGFTKTPEIIEAESAMPAGTVIAVSPDAGDLAKRSTVIKLTVAVPTTPVTPPSTNDPGASSSTDPILPVETPPTTP